MQTLSNSDSEPATSDVEESLSDENKIPKAFRDKIPKAFRDFIVTAAVDNDLNAISLSTEESRNRKVEFVGTVIPGTRICSKVCIKLGGITAYISSGDILGSRIDATRVESARQEGKEINFSQLRLRHIFAPVISLCTCQR